MLKLDMNLLWTVVNVLIMYALLRKFLFKPVQDVIAKRQQMVDASMADAQEAKNKAQAALNAAEDKLHNVDVEAAARREASEQLAKKQKEQEKQGLYCPDVPSAVRRYYVRNGKRS